MKKTLLFILTVFLSTVVNGQVIPIEKLISLRTKGLSTIEEYLKLNGWNFHHFEDGNDTGTNTISWSYNKGKSFDDKDKAEAWLYYFYKEGGASVIVYQFSNATYNRAAVAKLRSLGYEVSVTPHKDYITKMYRLKSESFAVCIDETVTSSGTSIIYSVGGSD